MASSWLVDLVWLNNASIPNFSIKGGLKVAQIFFPLFYFLFFQKHTIWTVVQKITALKKSYQLL